MEIRAHIFISGRVQGVFFRSWIRRQVRQAHCKQAQGLRLTGWVQNLADGRVEVVAEGEREKVNRLIELIKKGPRLAKVEHVDVSWEKAAGEFDSFTVTR